MDKISAADMWQVSNVTTNAKRIIVSHLSDCFSNRLIVSESCITILEQNHVPQKSDTTKSALKNKGGTNRYLI